MPFEGLSLRRTISRAQQLHGAGDAEGARTELEAFVRRFPKSQQGWMHLLWATGEAGGSIEDRLDVLRRAVEAVPYDTNLMHATVGHLMRAGMLIGDPRYIDEAASVVDRFEELLGPSIESELMRAALVQLKGDHAGTLLICDRIEEMLRLHPNESASCKLGLCLASIPGHEARGREMAATAARRLKDFTSFAYLAALLDDEDPAQAESYRDEARKFGARAALPEGYLANVILQAREDLRLERDYIENV